MRTKALLEARAFEQTRDLVNQALKAKWNPNQSNDGPWGPYIIQTFTDSVVYDWQGKTWDCDYSVAVANGVSTVTLSDPTEVQVTYAPMSEAQEEDLFFGFVALEEKALTRKNEASIKIIQPGWGTTGYYSKAILERDGPKAFKKGTKMYWNHPTAAEEAARPEPDLRDLAGELTGDAKWLEEGNAGPGLYAPAKVFSSYGPAVEEMAPHIGVSIRASGTAKKNGQAEGRKGTIIESITNAKSVDFVTEPGAGGQIVQLFESARSRASEHEEVTEVDEKEAATLRESVATLQTNMTALQESLKTTQEERDRLREGQALTEATGLVTTAINAATLPDITKTRLIARLSANPPLKEGAVDKDALTKLVESAISDETEYLKTLGQNVNPIRGMGSETRFSEAAPDKDAQDKLAGAFGKLGLSESAAKHASAGRN